MRATTNYGIIVPSADTDPDAVPTHLGNAMDQVDALLGAPAHGTFAGMPAAGKLGRLYWVDSGGTNGDTLWRDNGTSWEQVSYGSGVSSDLTTAAFGDTPSLGSKNAFAPSDHRHGMPSNPVVPHVAATDPHPQYLKAATGTLINSIQYAPLPLVTKSLAGSGSMIAGTPSFAFTAPPSGRVSLHTQLYQVTATTSGMMGYRSNGGTTIIGYWTQTIQGTGHYVQIYSALTPGNTYTFDLVLGANGAAVTWQFAGDSGYTSGSTIGNVPIFGPSPLVIEVFAA